jgi:hypothetical protein
MGNLVWNLITYGVTIGIIVVAFRAAKADQRERKEAETRLIASRIRGYQPR